MNNYIEAIKNLLSVTFSIGLLWTEALQWAVIIYTKKRNGAYGTMAGTAFAILKKAAISWDSVLCWALLESFGGLYSFALDKNKILSSGVMFLGLY